MPMRMSAGIEVEPNAENGIRVSIVAFPLEG
jgi:hypothetical protein